MAVTDEGYHHFVGGRAPPVLEGLLLRLLQRCLLVGNRYRPAAVFTLGLAGPIPERLRRAANLPRPPPRCNGPDGRLLGRVVVVEDGADGPLADLEGEQGGLAYGSNLSSVEASDKLGAIQPA